MNKLSFQTLSFSSSSTDFYFSFSIDQLEYLIDRKNSIIITDENLFSVHKAKLEGWKVIVIHAGEAYKNQTTVDYIISKLIEQEADRSSVIVGIGGGVVTDLTGYVASIYMRGVQFGFIPSSVLAMTDASIGGKNGIDVGFYKNIVGIIRQPSFICYDFNLLDSLPKEEWVNGFAEIIKHACILDADMFAYLENNDLDSFIKDKSSISKLVKHNALLKCKIVQEDEWETGSRKLLNFGHTLGHAIENKYYLKHGHAVAIGMVFAAKISEIYFGFQDTKRLEKMLERYQLPVFYSFDVSVITDLLKKDKKRISTDISYILLEKIGRGTIKNMPIEELVLHMDKLSL